MEPTGLSELFPLFNTAKQETLQWLLSIAKEKEYHKNKPILLEDTWGNAVYLLVSGWVKVRRLLNSDSLTLAILGPGEFFGEMAVIDGSPRCTDVISLCEIKILVVPAEHFLKVLYKDVKLNQQFLKLIVRRQRTFNLRFEIKKQPPAVKLARTLVNIAKNYGKSTVKGIEIFNIPPLDLADIADITVEDLEQVIHKLTKNKWLEIDSERRVMYLVKANHL